MAFEKNPLQEGVKTKLKDYSVDLENRIEGEFGNIATAFTIMVSIPKSNAYNADHPLTDYPEGLSFFRVENNLVGTPFATTYGTIITFHNNKVRSYSPQFVIRYDSAEMWSRAWQGSSWSNWKKIV